LGLPRQRVRHHRLAPYYAIGTSTAFAGVSVPGSATQQEQVCSARGDLGLLTRSGSAAGHRDGRQRAGIILQPAQRRLAERSRSAMRSSLASARQHLPQRRKRSERFAQRTTRYLLAAVPERRRRTTFVSSPTASTADGVSRCVVQLRYHSTIRLRTRTTRTQVAAHQSDAVGTLQVDMVAGPTTRRHPRTSSPRHERTITVFAKASDFTALAGVA
jgi:hypothetical protein